MGQDRCDSRCIWKIEAPGGWHVSSLENQALTQVQHHKIYTKEGPDKNHLQSQDLDTLPRIQKRLQVLKGNQEIKQRNRKDWEWESAFQEIIGSYA